MKKYSITDLTTNESKELLKHEFYESIIYNLTVAIDYEDITIDKGLQLMHNITIDDETTDKGFSEYINGFLYEIIID